MIASSLHDSTVECGVFGPIGASLTKARLRHLATVLWFSPYRGSLERRLERWSAGERGRGGAVTYLAHNPSRNAGISLADSPTLREQTPRDNPRDAPMSETFSRSK